MSGRLVSLGIAIALLVAIAGAIMAACYDVPRPDCGFLCGPNNACPDSYWCADDHRCHRIGTPATLVCGALDAAIPDDGAIADAPVDVMVDAPVDVMVDAPVDVMVDAPVDVMVDAPVDASI